MAVYEVKDHPAFSGYDLPEANGVLNGIRRFSRNVAIWSAERRAYYDAVHELSALSDRDLADIGIARCDIRAVSKDAAKAKRVDLRTGA
jgi:uncharacterized protein YjiS (DUF1127 family)